MKNRIIAAILATCLLLPFTACGSRPEPAQSSSSLHEASASGEESAASSSSSSASSEEGEESASSSPLSLPAGMSAATVGNIRFGYPTDLDTTESDNAHYYYYNDNAFFYVESVPLTLSTKDLDEETAGEYFDTAKRTFGTGAWSGFKQVAEPAVSTINNFEVWRAEYEMYSQSGMKYSARCAALYHGDTFTSLTLVCDINSYQSVIEQFESTLATLGTP